MPIVAAPRAVSPRDLYADRDDDRLALCLLLGTDPYPEGDRSSPSTGSTSARPATRRKLSRGAVARVPADATAFVHRSAPHYVSVFRCGRTTRLLAIGEAKWNEAAGDETGHKERPKP